MKLFNQKYSKFNGDNTDRGYQPKEKPVEKGYKPSKQVTQPVPPPKKP